MKCPRPFHAEIAGHGRAAADQVAWQQRHVMRDFADELLGAEDHIRNGIVLTLDAVENGSYHKFCGVDRRGDDRPERAEVVIALGAGPLGKGGILADNVGCRDVVDAGVAKNELIGPIDRHLAAGASDDDAEFALVSYLAIIRCRLPDDCVRRGGRRRRLQEIKWFVGLPDIQFRGERMKIIPQSDDLGRLSRSQ